MLDPRLAYVDAEQPRRTRPAATFITLMQLMERLGGAS